MADIAFLLLIFFLVTTTIDADKGLLFLLPPKAEVVRPEVHERDVFNILLNSKNELLVEKKEADMQDIEPLVREHLTNEGQDPDLSVSSQKAIVSVKTDRGTSYEAYIKVMDAVKAAYP